VQRGQRAVVRVAQHVVQAALLQVPQRDHARAAAGSQQRQARA
jgi:hypothetical protein